MIKNFSSLFSLITLVCTLPIIGMDQSLHRAIQSGAPAQTINALLDPGNVNQPNGELQTPLEVAINNNHVEAVECILTYWQEHTIFRREDILAFPRGDRDDYFDPPLIFAVRQDRLKIVNIILAWMEINLSRESFTKILEATDYFERAVLYYANEQCKENYRLMGEMRRNHPNDAQGIREAQINYQDSFEILKLLLYYGAALAINGHNVTPEASSAISCYDHSGAWIHLLLLDDIEKTAINGYKEELGDKISQNPHLIATNDALLFAAIRGNLDMVRCILTTCPFAQSIDRLDNIIFYLESIKKYRIAANNALVVTYNEIIRLIAQNRYVLLENYKIHIMPQPTLYLSHLPKELRKELMHYLRS